jgi:hypothetical protein
MGIRKNKGISENGDAELLVSLQLRVKDGKKNNVLAKVDHVNILPMLLKKTHLNNAERLFVSHLKNMVVGPFQTDVVCLIKELIKEELTPDEEESKIERLPMKEEELPEG